MTLKKRNARRPDEDYPVIEIEGYADQKRRRRTELERAAEMQRQMAWAHNRDVTSIDELVERFGRLGGH